MRNLFFCLFVCFGAFIGVLPCSAATLSESEKIQETTKAAFRGGDFAKIEGLLKQYRESRSRTSSGLWHLRAAYGGAFIAMTTDTKTEAQWEDLESKINKSIVSAPHSASGPIFLATAYYWHGFQHRGLGFADTVTPEGWKQFARYMGLARQTLEVNKATSSVDPTWYETMLKVAQGQSWSQEDVNSLLEEALRKEPLHYGTYFAAVDLLLPMWGGSLEKIEAFADNAVARTNQSEGSGMYARIFWYVEQRIGSTLFKRKSVWPKMKAGFEDLIKKYPDSWNKNAYAKYACQAGDYAVTARFMPEIGNAPILDAWNSQLYFESCKYYSLKK